MSGATSYTGRKPASKAASSAARGSSRKKNTKHEVVLRRKLWALGLRYQTDVAALPGRPDIVFRRARVVVFCDGDFWHGRHWEARKSKLQRGHNAPYWLAKIERNMERDRERTAMLSEQGWLVLRFWERDILRDADMIAAQIANTVMLRRPPTST